MSEDVDISVKSPKPKKFPVWIWAVVGLVLVASVAGGFFLFAPKETITLGEVALAEDVAAQINIKYTPDRKSYGYGYYGNKRFKLDEIFSELQPIPSDFGLTKSRLMNGNYEMSALCELSPAYYEQPEFFGDTFEKTGLKKYKEPDPTLWTPEGYGTYPHEIVIVTKPGELFVSCTIFHASWGVETYQGFKLVPVYPDAVTIEGKGVSVNSSMSEEFISVSINESDVLLSPSYLTFKPGWAKLVHVKLYVDPDTPVGSYGVGFDVDYPDISKAAEWRKEHNTKYRSVGGVRIEEPQFKVAVVVE